MNNKVKKTGDRWRVGKVSIYAKCFYYSKFFSNAGRKPNTEKRVKTRQTTWLVFDKWTGYPIRKHEQLIFDWTGMNELWVCLVFVLSSSFYAMLVNDFMQTEKWWKVEMNMN